MTDLAAIVAPAAAVDLDKERAVVLAARDDERKHMSLARVARQTIGASLLRVRTLWPERGPRARGWGEFLESINLPQQTAWQYMEYAKKVAPLVAEGAPDLPSYREAGVGAGADGASEQVPRDTVSLNFSETDQGAAPRYGGGGAGDKEKADSDECYTPVRYIDFAREVLGEIDLDPASCATAQGMVKARRFYTKEENGLVQVWRGRLWMNPPFSQPLGSQFVHKLLDEYRDNNVTAAIMLQNASTDVGWFHALAREAWVCFPDHRISFLKIIDGELVEVKGNWFGQCFFYLGPDPDRFCDVFSEIGLVGKLRGRAA